MESDKNYIAINKELWNKKTPIHLESDFYDIQGFINGNSSLNDIELALLGDLSGKTILHLQCHFGQDTISFARMGAFATGVDFSDKAIQEAALLSEKTNTKVNFICCDIYELPNFLDTQFDIVYTSYGTIGWLPDMEKWAQIVSRFLKPGGKFVFAEFHPVVWMFDYNFTKIEYNYFNSGAIVETDSGTYADKDARITQESVSWNHSISEVVNSLIKSNLVINSFDEYDYSPYNCFNVTVEIAPKKYRIKHLDNKIPMVYTIVATKKHQ